MISLDSIVTGARLKPPKIVLTGVGGWGKTTFASQADDPIFLCTEEGLGKLDVPRFEPRPGSPLLTSWDEILQALAVLHSGEHSFKTVVLDSIDFAEPLLWEHTAKQHGKENIEAFGYGKGYLFAVDEARVMLRWLDALRNDRGMAIVVIAHTETVRFEDPNADAYDRFQPRVHKRLAHVLHDWTDCLLFADYEKTIVDAESKGFDKAKRKRGVGLGQRLLHTEERPAFWAKNRYGLPPVLHIPHPSQGSGWQTFADAVAGVAATGNNSSNSNED